MRLWTQLLSVAIFGGVLLLGIDAFDVTDEPFSVPTVVAPDLFKWQWTESQIRSELMTVTDCRVEPESCSPATRRFVAIVNEALPYQGTARISHINRSVNLAIRAKSSGETWVSPLTALAIEEGDCKSYAVTKYAALSDIGVAENDLRSVIVHIRSSYNKHAVVAVRDADHWLILDNRRMRTVESRQLLRDYLPLFTLDYRGVREFMPSQNVASLPCSRDSTRIEPPSG